MRFNRFDASMRRSDYVDIAVADSAIGDAQSVTGGSTQVEDASADEWPPVVDPHHNTSAITRSSDPSAEWKSLVSGSHVIAIESLAAGRQRSVQTDAIPGTDTALTCDDKFD